MSPLLLLLRPPSVYIYLLILFVVIFYSLSMRRGLRRRCATYVFISTPKLLFIIFLNLWIHLAFFFFSFVYFCFVLSLTHSVQTTKQPLLFIAGDKNNYNRCSSTMNFSFTSRNIRFFPLFKIIYQTLATIAFCLVHRTTTLLLFSVSKWTLVTDAHHSI